MPVTESFRRLCKRVTRSGSRNADKTSDALNESSALRKELKRRIKVEQDDNTVFFGAINVMNLFYATNMFLILSACWQMLACSSAAVEDAQQLNPGVTEMCSVGFYAFFGQHRDKLIYFEGAPLPIGGVVLISVTCVWSSLLAFFGVKFGLKQIRRDGSRRMRTIAPLVLMVPFYLCMIVFYLFPACYSSLMFLVEQGRWYFVLKAATVMRTITFLTSALLPIIVVWSIALVFIIGLVRMALILYAAEPNSIRQGTLLSARNSFVYSSSRSRRTTPIKPLSRRMSQGQSNLSNMTWPSPGASMDGSAIVNSSFESPRSRYAGRTPRTPRLRMPLASLRTPEDNNLYDTPTKHVVINVEDGEQVTPSKQSLRERADALLMAGGYAYGNGTPSRRFLETVVEERETEFNE